MGQVVFGSCIEPGGMELDDYKNECECPECGGVAIERCWESAEGGSINPYWSLRCTVCPYCDGDLPYSIDDEFNPFRTEEDDAADMEAMLSYVDSWDDITPVWMQSPDYLALAQGVCRNS